jgi:hypothetical protein
MVELVGVIFSYIDPLSVPCCWAVCRRWKNLLGSVLLIAPLPQVGTH